MLKTEPAQAHGFQARCASTAATICSYIGSILRAVFGVPMWSIGLIRRVRVRRRLVGDERLFKPRQADREGAAFALGAADLDLAAVQEYDLLDDIQPDAHA